MLVQSAAVYIYTVSKTSDQNCIWLWYSSISFFYDNLLTFPVSHLTFPLLLPTTPTLSPSLLTSLLLVFSPTCRFTFSFLPFLDPQWFLFLFTPLLIRSQSSSLMDWFSDHLVPICQADVGPFRCHCLKMLVLLFYHHLKASLLRLKNCSTWITAEDKQEERFKYTHLSSLPEGHYYWGSMSSADVFFHPSLNSVVVCSVMNLS